MQPPRPVAAIPMAKFILAGIIKYIIPSPRHQKSAGQGLHQILRKRRSGNGSAPPPSSRGIHTGGPPAFPKEKAQTGRRRRSVSSPKTGICLPALPARFPRPAGLTNRLGMHNAGRTSLETSAMLKPVAPALVFFPVVPAVFARAWEPPGAGRW